MAEILTNAALAANAIYHSPALESGGRVAEVHVLVHADQAGNCAVEESDDNVNWNATSAAQAVAIAATFDGQPVDTLLTFPTQGKAYVRVVYVNGAAAQAAFHLEANLV